MTSPHQSYIYASISLYAWHEHISYDTVAHDLTKEYAYSLAVCTLIPFRRCNCQFDTENSVLFKRPPWLASWITHFISTVFQHQIGNCEIIRKQKKEHASNQTTRNLSVRAQTAVLCIMHYECVHVKYMTELANTTDFSHKITLN